MKNFQKMPAFMAPFWKIGQQLALKNYSITIIILNSNVNFLLQICVASHHNPPSFEKKRQDGHVQATCAGVAGGAAALGATGGATGLAAGSAVGAALGLVPAIFTFGLSIPVGAAIGGDRFLIFFWENG